LIGRHRKGLLFHAHLTIEGSVALTFFSVALACFAGFDQNRTGRLFDDFSAGRGVRQAV
jgi:hypothetical protein